MRNFAAKITKSKVKKNCMQMTPAVKAILIINIVFYAMTWLLGGQTGWFMNFNALHPIGTGGFAIYQYVTYMFMHGGWWHLFFNMWSLMIFGNAVEHQLGTGRFVWYYLMCGIGAALINQFCTMLGVIPPSLLVGASGAIYGVMAAAAYFFPTAKLFIIPIPFPIKAKWLIVGYIAIELFSALQSSGDGVAHMAHLGGMLFGFLLIRYWQKHPGSSQSFGRSKGMEFFENMKRRFDERQQKSNMHAEPTGRRETDAEYNARKRQNQEEIDAILDKIRRSGYDSLTKEEKQKLFDQSRNP
jgi:membrane associated rhomboid family serine protease